MGVIVLFRHLCARVRVGRIAEGYTFVRRIVVGIGVGVVAGGSSAVIVMMGFELCGVVVRGVVNASCITRRKC